MRRSFADRSAPQKHVWRAKVILATADGCGTAEIMRRSGKSKPVVWTWQARFMAEGVEGLLRDKTRKPGKPPLPPHTVQRVVDLALGPPPGESTHWTGRQLAKAAGVSLRSVQRILEAHQLAPHRIRTFKTVEGPGVCREAQGHRRSLCRSSAHAVVLSVDEKSQIQALDRTQPGLPMKKGRAGTMTHDYKRHGTTTLFAALNVLDGHRRRPQHAAPPAPGVHPLPSHTAEERVPVRMAIHAVVDHYATHQTSQGTKMAGPAIPAGRFTSRLPRRPGSTPSKASSPNSRDGVSSVECSDRLPTIQAAINRFVEETKLRSQNPSSGPLTPNAFLAAVKRGKEKLESIPLAVQSPKSEKGETMTYVDGFVAAVPTANREMYKKTCRSGPRFQGTTARRKWSVLGERCARRHEPRLSQWRSNARRMRQWSSRGSPGPPAKCVMRA